MLEGEPELSSRTPQSHSLMTNVKLSLTNFANMEFNLNWREKKYADHRKRKSNNHEGKEDLNDNTGVSYESRN